MKNFKLIKSEILFRGKVFDLQVDKIEYDSGNPGIREIAVHPGGAVVVPVTSGGKIILISQFRYPFQEVMLELPAGKLDKGEDPYSCAKRELEEEAGFSTDNIIKLGAVRSTPGFCTELLHIYLARDLQKGNINREEGESGMEIYEYSLDEIENKISNGEVVDAKSICGIYMAKNYLKI